mgnify:CR=1 FL=1
MRQIDLPGKLWVMSGTVTSGQLGFGVLLTKDVTQKPWSLCSELPGMKPGKAYLFIS